MDDEQLIDELCHRLDSTRPNIVQAYMFSTLHRQTTEKIQNLIDVLSSKSESESEEERINKVFCIRGLLTNGVLNLQVKTFQLVNEADVEKTKAKLDSVSDCSIYGAYKGTLTEPSKLSLDVFDGEFVSPKISLPAGYSPDGNCKRDGSSRPRPQPTHTNVESLDHKPSTSGISAKASKPSTSLLKTKNKSNSSTTQNSKTKAPSTQPKLFFAQSSVKKTATSKPREDTETASVSSRDSSSKSLSNKVKEEPLEVTSDKDSPSKTSDKENNTNTKEPKTKRTRVQMFTSSEESESENESKEKIKQSKKKRKSDGKTKESTNSQSGTGKTEVINRTGLVLDPEDLQNQSDEDETADADKESKERLSGEVSSEKPKRRQRNKAADEDNAEGDESRAKKNSKRIENFGSVKAGESCGTMKYVDKTYLDDEGFLVTEKVLEEIPQSKQTETSSKPKPVPVTKAEPVKKAKPVAKHQSSLLSFFKKT